MTITTMNSGETYAIHKKAALEMRSNMKLARRRHPRATWSSFMIMTLMTMTMMTLAIVLGMRLYENNTFALFYEKNRGFLMGALARGFYENNRVMVGILTSMYERGMFICRQTVSEVYPLRRWLSNRVLSSILR